MKYDKMIAINKKESDRKVNLAKKIIREMQDNFERITVAELVRRTELSRGFFYKNPEVRKVMEHAIQAQGTIQYLEKNGENKALEMLPKTVQIEVEKLKKANQKLESENANLKEKVDRLSQKVSKREISFLKKI